MRVACIPIVSVDDDFLTRFRGFLNNCSLIKPPLFPFLQTKPVSAYIALEGCVFDRSASQGSNMMPVLFRVIVMMRENLTTHRKQELSKQIS